MTGVHIAYAPAMKLRKEKSESVAENNCVMYCGPSQQSVNVVLGSWNCYSECECCQRFYQQDYYSLLLFALHNSECQAFPVLCVF